MNALAIDRDLELVFVFETACGVLVVAKQLRFEAVLGVEGEGVVHEESADGSKRQSLDVLVLRQVLSESERVGTRSDLSITDDQRADPIRRCKVALLQ